MQKIDELAAKKREKSEKDAVSPPPKEKKKKATFRENLESTAVAVLLALLIRQFAVEAFKIPTGSMAPTLLGEHKDVWCPNCNWYFALEKSHQHAYCPNCQYDIDASDYCPNDRTSLRISPLRYITWLGLHPHSAWCPNGDFTAHDGYNRVVHDGNRLLVNKISYDFWSPQRWDVMVFVYPLVAIHCRGCGRTIEDKRWHEGLTCPECGHPLKKEGPVGFSLRLLRNLPCYYLAGMPWEPPEVEEKNFIKRLIGLPGEKVSIREGDIYINEKIVRKPPKVQNVLWFPYYDSTYIEKKKVSEEWEATSSDWKVAPNRFEVSSHKGPQAPSLLRFRREIDDCYGYGGGGKGRNTVGDIRICFDVILSEASGGIDGRIQSGAENFAFHLRSASEAGKNVLTRSGVTLASDEKLVIRQGKSYHVNFYNVDATTGLDVDGRELFRKEYAPRANGNEGISDSGVAFGVDDTRAVFTNVKIYRDVYYTEMGAFPGEITLGKDEYFVLGDNSPNSKDGRAWGSLPARNVIGKAFVVFWPPSGIRVIR